jgi:GxxExxY protein
MDQRDEQTYAIIGAAIKVHKELGSGFLEAVYQEALTIEFKNAAIPFVKEAVLEIQYLGIPLSIGYRSDFVCFDTVIVEIKAIDRLSGKEEAQLLNYLKASKKPKGLLLNFGNRSLEYKRMVGVHNLCESVKSVD